MTDTADSVAKLKSIFTKQHLVKIYAVQLVQVLSIHVFLVEREVEVFNLRQWEIVNLLRETDDHVVGCEHNLVIVTFRYLLSPDLDVVNFGSILTLLQILWLTIHSDNVTQLKLLILIEILVVLNG